MLSKILNLVKQYQYDIFLTVCIILVAIIGFNLGHINALKQTPIKIEQGADIYKAISNDKTQIANEETEPKQTSQVHTDLRVVVSKNSTSKKYHFTWCPGAKQIKEENKIWFNSEQEAINAGYSLAGNCTK